MRARDRAIIDDIQRFRVMSRDDIADIHFAGLKCASSNANSVLTRLFRAGIIDRSTDYIPYLYFPVDKPIKKDSAKIRHFLEIVRVYRDMIKVERPSVFTVEAKYAKGLAEPDIFAIWKGSPLFVECQRSHYSQQVMTEKIERYESLKDSGLVDAEPWQPKNKPPVFPAILILSPTRYAVESDSLTIMQAQSIGDFLQKMNVQSPPAPVKKSAEGGIKFKLT